MRILIHTQFYPPEMGAPQARLSDLARRLKQMGHDVDVLSAMPNYPTGRIFDGYGGLYRQETMDGIRIHRAWIVPSNKPSMAHRLISYLSFSLSSLIIGLFKSGKADVIITESPPLFLALTGWLLAKLKGARWIMNVSDLWPDSAKYIGMLREKSLTYKMMAGLAHFLYRSAWLVTGQSREIISEIQSQVPEARGYHLSNGVDLSRFDRKFRLDSIRKRYLKQGETGFVFAGLHGLFQGLDQVVMTAEKLRDEPVRFILIGDGADKQTLIKSAKERGLRNIDFYPPVSHDEIPAILASMDVALITLKSAIRGAVPSKIYEAMASGIPVLLVAEGEARGIVQEAGAGLVVSPGDSENLLHAVRKLAQDAVIRVRMGEAGRRAAIEHFDRRKIVENFEKVLRTG